MIFMHTLADIHAAAESIRAKHWPSGDMPVDIDRIVEEMGIDIVPVAGLRDCGMDAYLAQSMREINVDLAYSMDERINFRFRFTLAHELGHVVLHQNEMRNEAARSSRLISG